MATTTRLSGVKGMNDVLPADMPWWQRFERAWWDTVGGYGYEAIRTPIVEPTGLFVRGIGEVTDIVEREMYSFVDQLNGEHLTLRPENTAAVVRSVIEHHLLYDGPKRLAYVGPMFRHERPQRGRYRQFHQAGVEALGWTGPDIDAEQIIMLARLWQRLELPRVSLQINCLGSTEERAAHRVALIQYFEAHAEQLDADAQRRLHSNPLRILDTKNPNMQALVEAAPKLLDYLGGVSRAHFDGVCGLLDHAGIAYSVNPRLVRGLDYYNLTVFEWVTDALGAQGTICGGGRYDPLMEMIGGQASPACGFAIGIERVLELLKLVHPNLSAARCDVYVVHAGVASTPYAMRLAEQVRDQGWRVLCHLGGGSFKSQMKKADASGAVWALIIGDDEVQAGEVTLKALRGDEQSRGQQWRGPVAELQQRLGVPATF